MSSITGIGSFILHTEQEYPEKIETVTIDEEPQETITVSISNAPSLSEINRSEALRLRSQMIKTLVGNKPFVVNAECVEKIKRLTGITTDELMGEIISIGKTLADPPISNFYVSLAALGKSGNIYLGINLEFDEGGPLNQTVHAEQFMTVLARNHKEEKIEMIKIFAPPCGHCRQFLNEIGEDAKEIKIVIPTGTYQFSELLPDAFGPQNLELKGGLLTIPSTVVNPADLPIELPLHAHAIAAADYAYAPYSKNLSGIAIRLKDNNVFTGSYLENAAFNPSLSPLQTALVALKAAGREYEEISEVILIEYANAKVKHESATRAILEKIAPKATFLCEIISAKKEDLIQQEI